ncbi:MAG: VOC family protein [Polyangiales bacterium]
MANSFVHIELGTGDVAAAKKFYGKVFDWKLKDMKMGPGMTYTTVDPGGGTGGGMMQAMPGQPTAWLAYVGVENLDKTIAKAKKAGAKIIIERQDVADMGSFGVFIDPTGAALGVWEPRAMPKKGAAKKKAAKKSSGKKGAKKKK